MYEHKFPCALICISKSIKKIVLIYIFLNYQMKRIPWIPGKQWKCVHDIVPCKFKDLIFFHQISNCRTHFYWIVSYLF